MSTYNRPAYVSVGHHHDSVLIQCFGYGVLHLISFDLLSDQIIQTSQLQDHELIDFGRVHDLLRAPKEVWVDHTEDYVIVLYHKDSFCLPLGIVALTGHSHKRS